LITSRTRPSRPELEHGTICSMTKEKGQSNRQATQRTKKLLLAMGATDFFARAGGVDPFRDLSLKHIAESAERARATVYRIWPGGKEEYIRDLTKFLLGDPQLFEKEFEEIQAVANETAGEPTLESLCAVASKDIGTLLDNHTWRAMEILAVGFMPQRVEYHSIAQAGYDAVDEETYGLYNIVLERCGRVPRPPFTSASIGKVLQALVEGAGIRQIFDREAFSNPLSTETPHGTYAYAVCALLAIVTAEKGDSRSLDELLTNLLKESEPPHG
jgi:AcrR family transcriptional regulator